MIPEIAGAAGGGLLGQIGDALSMPRRALWGGIAGLMGQEAPESGADLLHSLSGGAIDKESLLGQGLGFGAEVLGDPLTYAGGLLGKLFGLAGKAGGRIGSVGRVASPLSAIEGSGGAASSMSMGHTPSYLNDILFPTTKAAATTADTPLADLLEKMVAAEEGGKTGVRDVLASRRKTPIVTMRGGQDVPSYEKLAGPGLANEPFKQLPMEQRRMMRNASDALNEGAYGVYSYSHTPPVSGPTGVVALGRTVPSEMLGELKRHELSHALTHNAPRGTARGVLDATQTLSPEAGDASLIARMADEVLARSAEARSPLDSAGKALDFLTAPTGSKTGRAEANFYLRMFGLDGTPQGNFATDIAPQIMNSVLDQGGRPGLLDFLRPLAAKAREMKLGIAAPLMGGGGLAAMLGNNNDA